MDEKEKDIIENKDDDAELKNEPGIYELGYHILPTESEENLATEVSTLKSTTVKHGGVFVAEEFPKQIQLSYKMARKEGGKKNMFDSAYFGWIKFEIDGGSILELQSELKENKQLLRFIILKTVRESTLAPKKLAFEKTEKPTPTTPIKSLVKKEKSVPISEEELDKTIEKLVSET